MQVHGPSNSTDKATVYLNGTFGVVEIGHVSVFVYTPDEADLLIRAAVKLKRLLLGEPPENDPAIAMSAYGPAEGSAS